MDLLKVNEEHMHRAEPTATARTLKPYADIVRRDRGSSGDSSGRFKQRATQELAYIYHMADFNSPYFKVPEEERAEQLIRDIFGEEDWEPDELVKHGLALYKKLQTTPSMKLLDAANQSVGKLETYLRNVDFSEDSEGRPKYSPKDLISSLEKLGKVVDGLSELKKQVQKEQQKDKEAYGGVELNEFNK